MDESARQRSRSPRGEAHVLQPGVDYLYCEMCGQHVPCIPLARGTWEVQCSRCVGDCGLCACCGQRRAETLDDAPPDPHVHVAHGKPERPHQTKEMSHE